MIKSIGFVFVLIFLLVELGGEGEDVGGLECDQGKCLNLATRPPRPTPALSNQADPLIVCSANTRQGLDYKKGLKGD